MLRIIAVLWLFCLNLPVHASDALPWALTVTAIEVGRTSKSTETLWINRQLREVKVGHAFPVGSLISTPPHTTLQLLSSNDVTLRLLPGTRLRAFSGSGLGEEYGLETGQILFDVKRKIGFFNVRLDRFLVQVKNARYSATLNPANEVGFNVDTGEIRILREGQIKIDEGEKEASVTTTEILQDGEHKTYRLDSGEYLARFRSNEDAKDHFVKKLATDRISGDRDRIVTGLHGTGSALISLGKPREAAEVWEELLDLQLQSYPDALHPDIGKTLYNLGTAYQVLGDADNLRRAINFYEESLKLMRRFYQDGPDDRHPDIAASMNNLDVAFKEKYGQEGGTGIRAWQLRKNSYKEQREAFRKLSFADRKRTVSSLLESFRGEQGIFETIYQYVTRAETVSDQDLQDVFDSLLVTSDDIDEENETKSINERRSVLTSVKENEGQENERESCNPVAVIFGPASSVGCHDVSPQSHGR